MTHNTLNFADAVACDLCNCPGDHCYGGIIMGSYAICGCCCEDSNYLDEQYEHKDEIDAILDPNTTFRENVLRYREQQYGSTDLVMRFWSWDDMNPSQDE